MTLRAPSSWRGHSIRDAEAGDKREGLLKRVTREVVEHPAETAAIIAMGVAAARLLTRKERAMSVSGNGRRRPSRMAPIGLMAAICMMMLSGCALMPRPVVHVAPDPLALELQYRGDLSLQGEAIAREYCTSCHAVAERPDGRQGRAAAPPLNALLAHRSSDQLADALVDGLTIVHGAMPIYDFSISAEVALMAYLEAIADRGEQTR